MNNKIIDVQDIIFKQLKRLDNSKSKEEIARANAISNVATNYIKSINVQLAILNISQKLEKSPMSLEKELGICAED